jgi:1-acyl-sn-glycerol-3-phosphate acyltransferase
VTEDVWGYDDEFTGRVETLLGFLYDRWWRVTAVGAERVPAQGPALLVANRSGDAPWEALMVARALERRPRALVDAGAFEVPFLGAALRRLGAVAANPPNALRLLGEGHRVLVLPRSTKDRARYEVGRLGRFGIARIARDAGAPVVPVAIVGAEEAYTVPVLGNLGLATLPSRWRIEFGDPVDVGSFDQPLEAAEAVRERIQSMVHDNLVRREVSFF